MSINFINEQLKNHSHVPSQLKTLHNTKAMIRNSLIFAIFSLFVVSLHAQGSYKVVFEGEDHGVVSVIHGTPTEEYAVGISYYGYCENNFVFEGDIYSFSNQSPGDTVHWDVNLHRVDTSMDVVYLNKLNSGEWLIAGRGASKFSIDTIDDYKFFNWMMMLDQNKNIIWEKHHDLPLELGQTSEPGNLNVMELTTGNYLYALPVVNDTVPWIASILLREVSSNGEVLFTKIIEKGIGRRSVLSLCYNHDSTAIMLHVYSHEIDNCTSGVGAYILDTTNYDVNQTICYKENATGFDAPYNAMLHPEGDLIVAGSYDVSLSSSNESYLGVERMDTSYQVINRVLLTDPDTITYGAWERCLDINAQGEICVAGSFDNALGFFTEYYDLIYLAKLDSELNLIHERYIGRDAEYLVNSMAATSDGGIAVGGFQYDYMVNQPGEGDPFVIKTDAGLWLDTPQIEEKNIHRALLYPNPGGQEVIVRTTIKQSVFRLFDISNRLLLEQPVDELITTVNTRSFQAGTYTWTITKAGQVCDRGIWIKN